MRGCSALLAVVVVLAGNGMAADRPTVLAYYYPWYTQGDWSRHGYQGTPLLGKYGTDSPMVAQRQIDWCADYGIDGLFVSWWGSDHLADRHLRGGLLKAENLKRIRFAIFYESLGLLDRHDGAKDGVIDFDKPQVMTRLIDDFQYLAKHYFKHPQYVTVGNRPLVGFYVTRTFRRFGPEHIERLERAIEADLYIVADEVFFGEQSAPDTARNGDAFDAYTAYNMLENAKVRSGDTALTYHSREAFPLYRRWAGKRTLMPGIFPSYWDFRGNKVLPGDASQWATLLDAASAIADSNPMHAPRMILVTSFNEWWEGTTIEPAKEYGTRYLEVIRRFKTGK